MLGLAARLANSYESVAEEVEDTKEELGAEEAPIWLNAYFLTQGTEFDPRTHRGAGKKS